MLSGPENDKSWSRKTGQKRLQGGISAMTKPERLYLSCVSKLARTDRVTTHCLQRINNLFKRSTVMNMLYVHELEYKLKLVSKKSKFTSEIQDHCTERVHAIVVCLNLCNNLLCARLYQTEQLTDFSWQGQTSAPCQFSVSARGATYNVRRICYKSIYLYVSAFPSTSGWTHLVYITEVHY